MSDNPLPIKGIGDFFSHAFLKNYSIEHNVRANGASLGKTNPAQWLADTTIQISATVEIWCKVINP